jgi:probable rRNA maturation factor
MELTIISSTKKPVPRQFLFDWVSYCQKKLEKKDMIAKGYPLELSLVFLGPSKARKLNKQYRSKDKATNVLSFESDDPLSLGDLVFCPTVIEKEAKREKLSYRKYLAYLVLHGILHLLGMDHEKDLTNAEEMYAIQDSLFEDYFG